MDHKVQTELLLSNEPTLPIMTYYDQTPPSELIDSEDEIPVLTPITDREDSLVAIIGVGYVGEHLVNIFSNKYAVVGYDVSESRILQLRNSYTDTERISFTNKTKDIAEATHFLISVPTLLLPDKSIDSSALRAALSLVSKYARTGSVVVIESSVAVGMTRTLLGPIAQAKNFSAGMSPERVDPGRTEPPPRTIAKIVSGLDDVVPGSTDAITRLYSRVFDTVVPVSSPEVAEMMKLYENCQRMLCIAYANEMANACLGHGIDPFEVCRAAATKPFGYMPFTPGLGVGGHCIPVNPYYLFANSEFPLLRAAAETMRDRPREMCRRIISQLLASWEKESRPKVLVVGIGFKPGQSHVANSPGLELAKQLVVSGQVDVEWADPLVKQEVVPQVPRLDVENWTVAYLDAHFELIVVAFRQHGLDFDVLGRLERAQVQSWCGLLS